MRLKIAVSVVRFRPWAPFRQIRLSSAILLTPNDPDILPRRPRPPSLDRIGRIVEPWRRGMAAGHQPVYQRFVFGGEAIVERAQIIVPLRFGARAGDHARYERRVQHP